MNANTIVRRAVKITPTTVKAAPAVKDAPAVKAAVKVKPIVEEEEETAVDETETVDLEIGATAADAPKLKQAEVIRTLRAAAELIPDEQELKKLLLRLENMVTKEKPGGLYGAAKVFIEDLVEQIKIYTEAATFAADNFPRTGGGGGRAVEKTFQDLIRALDLFTWETTKRAARGASKEQREGILQKNMNLLEKNAHYIQWAKAENLEELFADGEQGTPGFGDRIIYGVTMPADLEAAYKAAYQLNGTFSPKAWSGFKKELLGLFGGVAIGGINIPIDPPTEEDDVDNVVPLGMGLVCGFSQKPKNGALEPFVDVTKFRPMVKSGHKPTALAVADLRQIADGLWLYCPGAAGADGDAADGGEMLDDDADGGEMLDDGEEE